MKKIVGSIVLVIIVLVGIFLIQDKEEMRISKGPETIIVQPSVFDFEPEDYDAFSEIQVENMSFEHVVDVLSVGDIMAHTIQFEAAKVEDGYDFYPQFEAIAEKVHSKDFAIANLETVFAGEDKRYSGKNMIFNAPDSLGESIKKAGFDIVTTANNHSLDRGLYGIKRTIEVLDKIGLLHTGTYATDEHEILVFEEDGISFALLSYSYSTNGWPIPTEDPDCINMMIEEEIIEDIQRAQLLGVDFIMVANHWGLEYHLDENHHQRNLADALFYAGADIILGTHPHVLQPFEHQMMKDHSGKMKDKFIIYSQGNFISGQRTYPRQIGMYINFEFTREGSQRPFVSEVSVMPTYVEEGYKEGQRFMRILDMQESLLAYEAGTLDIDASMYQSLLLHRDTFVKHLASKTNRIPYLNEDMEYVLYEVK